MRRGVRIDDSELRDLQIDLKGAPARVQRNARATLREASVLVAAGMHKDFDGHVGSWFHKSNRHKKAAKVGRTVSHELVGPLEAEIGFEHGKGKRAANLALVLARPTVLNPTPTVDEGAALRRSTPAILHMFGDVVEESPLGKGGGR